MLMPCIPAIEIHRSATSHSSHSPIAAELTAGCTPDVNVCGQCAAGIFKLPDLERRTPITHHTWLLRLMLPQLPDSSLEPFPMHHTISTRAQVVGYPAQEFAMNFADEK
jgi:hypothetical protein